MKYLVILLSFFFYSNALINERVLICGICQNISKQFSQTAKIIENIGELFTDYRALVYENNSTDNTKILLQNWNKDNPKIFIYSENIDEVALKKSFINEDYLKSEGTSRARNIILDKIFLPEFEPFTYVIWIDMDFTVPPAYEGIIEVFETKKEWDAVFAYGITKQRLYWDWLAFRDGIEPFGPELVGHYEWYKAKENLALAESDDWYHVYSAFGGCGIYKKSSIKGCRYAAVVTKDLETLSKQIIEKGKLSGHPIILKYLDSIQKLKFKHKIPFAVPGLKKFNDYYHTGFILQPDADALIWKMSSFTYQYPCTCDHVPFHASMIVNGHNKLFINPRMIFTYA